MWNLVDWFNAHVDGWMAIIIFLIILFIATEIIFYFNVRDEPKTKKQNWWIYTIGMKFQSLVFAATTVLILLVIICFYGFFLLLTGMGLVIWGYLYLNKRLAQRYAKKPDVKRPRGRPRKNK